jgi:Family of unknown function (DUF6220)
MQAARTIYRYLVALIFVGIIVQVGLAGYGAFHSVKKADDDKTITKHTLEHGWDPHSAFGTLLGILSLILLIVALISRFEPRFRNWNIALFVLFLLQVLVLAQIGGAVPALGWIHPINALALFGITGWLAHWAWRGWQTAPDPAPAPAST